MSREAGRRERPLKRLFFSRVRASLFVGGGDLQRALGNLIDAGKVQNLDARGKRRKKFLHFDKGSERLQITEENK